VVLHERRGREWSATLSEAKQSERKTATLVNAQASEDVQGSRKVKRKYETDV
jgi:hypothetical protein